MSGASLGRSSAAVHFAGKPAVAQAYPPGNNPVAVTRDE
jgi:hypothetical protein